ncbi:ABC transporter ATP-binding protein [Paenibacillus psychroresistens]|uniref:ABC transporter ATP-binding protein n=1 Tax=Paenibacillus psychroresistens TaxID=1778678 RepID=A0A6B8RQ45_9BACL|nr:ABC transporter ATP-binding protein [Paenibacillus psychroresistens]QGQ98490.1 ABC transporter ATP-binding protein [Paenibacillus psychroresistens]
MNANLAAKIEMITKKYKLYNKPMDRLKESIHPFKKNYHKDFYAINNVSFEIKKGETVGIIGKNGSGKSTMLKMITGVLTPTSGTIQINGTISALLELGAGFNPEYTGIENIYMNGLICGFTKSEMDEKLDDILSFADIGEFVYQPVKIYSSGMFVRLAFAVAINVDPDILIVDEALSVGDMRFQQKCYRKIEEYKSTKTILLVSHDMATITNYCDRAIWINEGELIFDGSPREIVKKYQAFMADSNLSKYTHVVEEYVEPNSSDNMLIDPIDRDLDVLGDNSAIITGISLLDAQNNEKINLVNPDQQLKLLIKVKSNQAIIDPIVGFSIKDRIGNVMVQTNNYVLGITLDPLVNNSYMTYCFNFSLPNLNKGQYTISPAIASGSQSDHIQHSWIHDAIVFNVLLTTKHDLEGFLIMNDVDFSQIN